MSLPITSCRLLIGCSPDYELSAIGNVYRSPPPNTDAILAVHFGALIPNYG